MTFKNDCIWKSKRGGLGCENPAIVKQVDYCRAVEMKNAHDCPCCECAIETFNPDLCTEYKVKR